MKDGTDENENDVEKGWCPWFAPRVILKWIEEVWKEQDAWEHWSIDNYDSEETYQEWNLQVPEQFMKDGEIRKTRFHQLRVELIQVE